MTITHASPSPSSDHPLRNAEALFNSFHILKFQVLACEAWLQNGIGYHFRDLSLLETALTHCSANKKVGENYEQLEFFGDGLVNLFAADKVCRKNLHSSAPFSASESGISVLCSNAVLQAGAVKSGLGEFLIHGMSNPESLSGKTHADMVESVAAALFKDSGSFDTVKSFLSYVLADVAGFRPYCGSSFPKFHALQTSAALSTEVQDFANCLLPSGSGAGDIVKALTLGTTGSERSRSILYAVGSRVFFLLARESVFESHKVHDEGVLSNLSVKYGKELISKISADAPWKHLVEFEEPASLETAGKSRLLSLLGVVYLHEGLDRARKILASWSAGAGAPMESTPIIREPAQNWIDFSFSSQSEVA